MLRFDFTPKQYLISLQAGQRDQYEVVRELSKLEGVSMAVLVSTGTPEHPTDIDDLDIFAIMIAPSLAYVQQQLDKIDAFSHGTITLVLYDPATEAAEREIVRKAATKPLISSVPGMPPARGLVHRNFSSQAGLAAFAVSTGRPIGIGAGGVDFDT